MAAYIKFDGVDGEAQDKDHKGWSDLLSFSWGVHKPGGGATGSLLPVPQDLSALKVYDKASPKLAEAVCTGKVWPKVELEVARAAGGDRPVYLKYELKNVLISSYQTGGSQADDRLTENLTLNFTQAGISYAPQSPDGTTGEPVVVTIEGPPRG